MKRTNQQSPSSSPSTVIVLSLRNFACLFGMGGSCLVSKFFKCLLCFLHSGILVTSKGSAEAIQASAQAQAQNIQIYVVGVATNGEEVAEISQLASPSNCADQNFFLTSNVNELASRLTEPLARKVCGMQPQATGSTSFHLSFFE